MNQRSQKSIEECLRQNDIQMRIWNTILEARENVTVTISRAANLFGFSESRLREWEKRGLLETKRPILSQQGKESTGHRQYSSMELDKLAIISVLLKEGYTPGDIPLDVDQLWREIVGARPGVAPVQRHSALEVTGEHLERRSLPIDKRVEEVDHQEFWRYFVSQALRISLLLICEDIPDTLTGIILPLEDRKLVNMIHIPEDLPHAGLALVGWLGGNNSFYTFLDEAPHFEFPSDFRLEKLVTSSAPWPTNDRVLDNVIIVLQRKARSLSLSAELLATIRRVLSLVYARIDSWKLSFDYQMHDWIYQIHDLERVSNVAGDRILNSLLERVIELGRKTSNNRNHWSFCTLLLPNDAGLPIQQQNLIIRAQTRKSPYEIGVTSIDHTRTDSVSLKAFQSGHITYFAETLIDQSMAIYQPSTVISREYAGNISTSEELPEKTTRSAIAIPIIGEYGISAAVLYIASEDIQAFSRDDQRALRIISRMIEELLLSSQSARQVFGKLGEIISNSSVVDATFRGFASETEYMTETEALLADIQKEALAGQDLIGDFSIISVDIDNQSSIAIKYGNRLARNLSQQMGLRINTKVKNLTKCSWSKLFHISADKYYWLVRDLALSEVQDTARRLKDNLQMDYLLDSSFSVPGSVPNHVVLPKNMLGLSEVTIHIGISAYTFEKLAELLYRYPENTAVQNVRALITRRTEEVLERGKSSGGNCILSWKPEIQDFGLLST